MDDGNEGDEEENNSTSRASCKGMRSETILMGSGDRRRTKGTTVISEETEPGGKGEREFCIQKFRKVKP
jgi:hypothetical protein